MIERVGLSKRLDFYEERELMCLFFLSLFQVFFK